MGIVQNHTLCHEHRAEAAVPDSTKYRVIHSTARLHTITLHYNKKKKKTGERGGTVVNVLCHKSEGRWFDPR